MKTALRVATGEPVRADDDNCPAGPYKCDGCGASVERVNTYWIHKEDPELARRIPGFFRLKSGDENCHRGICRYTPAGQVKLLVADAEAVEDAANPFEQMRRDAPVTFRLNIPTEEMKRSQRTDGVARDRDTAAYRARVERVWSGSRLEAYCRSAVGLAKLWQAMEGTEGRTELRETVCIAVEGKVIPWSDFFFPPHRLDAFATRLERGGLGHPAAVLVHAASTGVTANGRSFVKFTPVPSTRTRDPTRIAIDAYGSSRIIGRFECGRHYIVFGEFWQQKARIFEPPGGKVAIRYRNFAVAIYRASQFSSADIVEPLKE